jgi:hypothetical protein
MAQGTNPYSVEYEATNLTGLGTTTISSNIGPANGNQSSYLVLHSITINTKGAASNTLTVYDNTTGSGTKIAAIDTTAQTQTLFYDIICRTGITVVSATGTGADITVSWCKARS